MDSLQTLPTKTCSKCGQAKPRTAFFAHRGRRDGLQSWCRDCIAERNRTGPQRRSHRPALLAHHGAVDDLIAAHPDEFERLLAARRAAVGLST